MPNKLSVRLFFKLNYMEKILINSESLCRDPASTLSEDYVHLSFSEAICQFRGGME